jgi:hypothetical protein
MWEPFMHFFRWLRPRKGKSALCTLLFLFALCPSAASAQRADINYQDADGGFLIYSVGVSRIGMHFSFPYHRIFDATGAEVGDWEGRIRPRVGGMWRLRVLEPHFTNQNDSGHVVIRRLPPGRYRIENFGFSGSNPSGAAIRWSSSVPFRIDFDIVAGQATYIGRFIRSPSVSLSNTSLYETMGAAGYFVISNQFDEDSAIARRLDPNLPALAAQVIDIDQFGSSILRSTYIP